MERCDVTGLVKILHGFPPGINKKHPGFLITQWPSLMTENLNKTRKNKIPSNGALAVFYFLAKRTRVFKKLNDGFRLME
jgi:hypothetical protein